MQQFLTNTTVRTRRAVHKFIMLFPQGLRTRLAENNLLTKIFLFFDRARYLPLHSSSPKETVTVSYISEPTKIPRDDYDYKIPETTQAEKEKLKTLNNRPLISIVMTVFDVDPKWLELAIQSIQNQWYENWELCIVDDCSNNTYTHQYLRSIRNPRIKIHFSPKNQGISAASNMALSMATGNYIALLDHDDELTPDALFEVVKAINDRSAEFIYSDEDKLELDDTYCDPHFKSDYSLDMFLSQNYLSHLGVIKKELIDRVGGFTTGLEGAQDYDLYLKVLEHTDKVVHIPKVLYHWRKIPGSTAAVFDNKSYAQDAGALALSKAMQRRGVNAEVVGGKDPGTYRVKYALNALPLISIIIPFKDKPELLKVCVESILEKSSYSNFEIIGISNNSVEEETFAEMDRLKSLDTRILFFEHNVPFNFSEINNYAVHNHANGEHVLLLNNDIEIMSPEWIESLLEFSQRKDVGVVGAKLYYPDGKLQHAGIIIGIGGVAGHSHKYGDGNHHGYFSRPNIVQNLSAVTGACLMVKKTVYEEVGGLDAKNLKIAFNDVDFCLRIREKGYLNVYTPYCEAIHHESVSRGYEETKEQKDRFNQEVSYMTSRHEEFLKNGDPYYNQNLTLFHEDFSLAPALATAIEATDQGI